MIKGSITISEELLEAGDDAAIQADTVVINCLRPAEFLFFDLLAMS